MGNFNIRWARAKDARSIAALWHRVWHATYSRHFTADALKLCTLNLFERAIGASLFEVDASLPIDERVIRPTALVAEGTDSALHGFAVLRGGAELEHLYVDPALPRDGARPRCSRRASAFSTPNAAATWRIWSSRCATAVRSASTSATVGSALRHSSRG